MARDDDKKRDRNVPRGSALDPEGKVFEEARDRLQQWRDWEGDFCNLYVQDVKFANADSDNGWQWPNDLRRDREVNKRPALTINKVEPLCNLIVNDMRENVPSISIKPVGGETSFRAAQIFEGFFRHVERESAAQDIYDDAAESTVQGGIAYWRVASQYESDDSFNQILRIAPIRDQMGVALDPNIKRKDGLDAKWGFIFEELPHEEFEREHPEIEYPAASTGLDQYYSDWITNDGIRMAEYYRIKETADELIYVEDAQGNHTIFKKSELAKMPVELRDELRRLEKDEYEKVKRRKIMRKQLEWYKIAGGMVIEAKKDLKGQYVPIVRMVGKERVIAGSLIRRGHVRLLKDSQRMFNYNASGQAEVVALQTKSPWTGAAAAFSGNEQMWNTANVKNWPYLPFKHTDAEGNPLPPEALPKRIDTPAPSAAFHDGLQTASMEMEMASGQYSPSKGEPGNERSGKAIDARTRASNTATGHFAGNLAVAVRTTAVIILDLAPYYYDTDRVIQILGRDGAQTEIRIVPDQDEALIERKEKDEVKVLWNPKVGKYQVAADVGPAYATQRQEAWNAFVQIVTQNSELTSLIGDLGFQSADFPLADKIAERMRKEIKASKPYLFDDEAPTPAVVQLKQQLEMATKQASELLEQLSDTKRKLTSRDQKRDVEAYRAESDRLAKVANAVGDLIELSGGMSKDANEMRGLIEKTMRDMLMENNISGEVNNEQAAEGNPANAQGQQQQGQQEQPPVPGAQKAADGNWYLKHQDGRVFKVDDDGTPPNAG